MTDALTMWATSLWQPWLTLAVIGVGAVVTVVSLLLQVRGLPQALVDARTAMRGRDTSRIEMVASIAAVSGLASLIAGALAVELGGAGALPWCWIATLLVMAMGFGEATLAQQPPNHSGLRRGLAQLWLVTGAAGIICVYGLWQARLVTSVFATTSQLDHTAVALVFAAAFVPFAVSAVAHRALLALFPWALLIVLVAGAAILLTDPLSLQLRLGDAINEALAARPILTGGGAGLASAAVIHGTMNSLVSTGVLFGAGRAMPTARVAMLPALIGGLVMATLGGALALTTPDEPVAIDLMQAPGSNSSAINAYVPLERPHARGLRPSKEHGQVIVLPKDTPLEVGKYYAMVARSNPRGVPLARLDADKNVVLVPTWQVSEHTDAVIFRAKDPKMAKLAAWDVRVPCQREVIGEQGGPQLVHLRPKDPELKFSDLIARFELGAQPFVPLADFHFIGKVAEADSPEPDLGRHLAMYEAPEDDRPFNPRLHEFFRVGYRGPYADVETQRPPWAFVAREGLPAEVGQRIELALPASVRGAPIVRLNRAGSAEVPAWDFLMRAHTLVLRHKADPSRDIEVAVNAELDGPRIRLRPQESRWEDLREVAKMDDYEPIPYLRVPTYRFAAEVHSSARLAQEYYDRLTLIPLHPQGEAQGPWGDAYPYAPHPADLTSAGFSLPIVPRSSAARLGSRLGELPGWGRSLASFALFVLALASLAGWHTRLAGMAAKLRTLFGVVLVAAAALAGVLSDDLAGMVAVIAVGVAAMWGLTNLIAGLGDIRQAR